MGFLKNIKISTKIFGGFGIVLALLVIVGSVGGLGISGAAEDFTRYRQIALQTNQAGRVQANLLEARLAVKNFIISPSEESIQTVEHRMGATHELVVELADMIEKPELAEIVSSADERVLDYVKAFKDVTLLQDQRNELVNGSLNKIGPQIERDLTAIMESAYKAGDASASHQAGVTLRALLLERLYATRFLVTNDEPSFNRAVKESEVVKEATALLLRELQNPQRRKLAASAISLHEKYVADFRLVNDTINQRNAIISGTLDRIGPQVAKEMEDVKLAIKEEQDQIGPSAIEAMNAAKVTDFAVTGVAVAFGIFAAWLIGLGISRPISAITTSMDRIAGGDLAAEVPGLDHGDEIGKMAAAVEVFKNNAVEVKRLEQVQIERDKVASEEQKKSMAKLADEFDSSVGNVVNFVSSAATEMQASAETLNNSAESASSGVSAVAATTRQTSETVQNIASATEELSSSINEIRRQVGSSSEMADRAVDQAAQTTEQVQGLVETSNRIGAVIDMIRDIAEQTNLLALNATIEAARAGDSGKGFAVVANEVKTLAAQTAKATEDISSQVQNVQSETQKAAESIEIIANTIREINEVGTSISSAIEEQHAATQEIAGNIEQTAVGASEMTSNIGSVSEQVGETGNSANEVLGASKELAVQADKMEGLVSSFLINVRQAS